MVRVSVRAEPTTVLVTLAIVDRQKVLKRFGRSLRDHRLRAGLSQEALAAKAGLDRTYVGGAERGERNVAILNVCRFAVALQIQPSELLRNLDSG